MSNTSLKITVAGIRGKIGESLIPEVALNFAEIFGTVVSGGKVVLGSDPRLSNLLMKSAIISGLIATGCEIIDIGLVATPTVQIMVKHLKADGGIMITASHNPVMWNGLKFISSQGIFLDEKEMEKMFFLYEQLLKTKKSALTIEEITTKQSIAYKNVHKLGSISNDNSAAKVHIEKILKHVDIKSIKGANLKVVVDCCNGSGAVINPLLFNKLGITPIFINEAPTGDFQRQPEPLPTNIKDLCKAVIDNKAHIGFAQDADADRLAIVNEKGEPIGEDYTLVLTMKYLLDRHPNPKNRVVATNLSTTRAFDDVANQYQAKIIHTKIGEVNVSKALMENNAIVGGEGNGGVIIPEIGYGRDSFAGIAFILEYLAKSQKTVSELVNEIPNYKVVKKKKDLASNQEIASILEKTKNFYKNESQDLTDGVKVIFKDSWLHVRASNTEPIIRYFAEAKTLDQANKLIENIF